MISLHYLIDNVTFDMTSSMMSLVCYYLIDDVALLMTSHIMLQMMWHVTYVLSVKMLTDSQQTVSETIISTLLMVLAGFQPQLPLLEVSLFEMSLNILDKPVLLCRQHILDNTDLRYWADQSQNGDLVGREPYVLH